MCFRGFLEITEPHVFFNKVFILAIKEKAFRLEVMLSVLSLFILFPVVLHVELVHNYL